MFSTIYDSCIEKMINTAKNASLNAYPNLRLFVNVVYERVEQCTCAGGRYSFDIFCGTVKGLNSKSRQKQLKITKLVFINVYVNDVPSPNSQVAQCFQTSSLFLSRCWSLPRDT